MARQMPLVACGCGRLHRSWNRYKLCRVCVRERRNEAEDAVHAEVVELERERRRRGSSTSPAERVWFDAIYARWLAKQSLEHPWRVAGRGGGV
jgi:hypothetical protein